MNMQIQCWSPTTKTYPNMYAMNWGNCKSQPTDGASVANEVLVKRKTNPNGLPFLWGAEPLQGYPYFAEIKNRWLFDNYQPLIVPTDIEDSTLPAVTSSIVKGMYPSAIVGEGVQPIGFSYRDKNGVVYPVGTTSPSGYSSPEMYDEGGNFYNNLNLPVDWNSCGKTCLDVISLTGGGQQGHRLIPWIAYPGYDNNGRQWNVRTFQMQWRLLVLKAMGCQTVLLWNPRDGENPATDRDDQIVADALARANAMGHIQVTNATPDSIVMDSRKFGIGGTGPLYRYQCLYSDFLLAAQADVDGKFIF